MKKRLMFLALILLLAVFFRLYNFDKFFLFNHDQDLYSWIAKDILVNHHQRLVGQITSVDGVFIGSMFYYIVAVTYKLFGMDPLSVVVPLTLIGLASVLSMYLVGKQFFGPKTGLIAALIYSCSWGFAAYDRWSVPTEPTMLWSIWFLFLCWAMLRGELKWLPLYGLLTGLIWQIHIAFLPILPLPILAYVLSEGSLKTKLARVKLGNLLVAILVFGIVSLPFWLFEFKHGFSQIRSMVSATQAVYVGPTGLAKFNKVIDASTREMQQRFVVGFDGYGYHYWWMALLVISVALIWAKKVRFQSLLIIWLWIGLIGLVQFLSKRPVSEYYFSNLAPPALMIMAISLGSLLEVRRGKYLVYGILCLYVLANIGWILRQEVTSESYLYRMQLVEYIKKDVSERGYHCVGVNYIANFGTGVGFRYLFWNAGVAVVRPSAEVPVYNILIPWQVNEKEVKAKFGRFGVIEPLKTAKTDKGYCDNLANRLDPLLGYVD